MRTEFKLLLLLTCSLFYNCSISGSVEKPDNLIEESVMENVLYDITVLEAMSTFRPKNPDFEKVYGRTYIYMKYGIDSLQLLESDRYYAKHPRVYHRMYSKILKRMNKTKDSLDVLGKLEKSNQK